MNMKAFCMMIMIAAQAAAFSMAKIPATNFHFSSPSSRPLITRHHAAGAIHSMKSAPMRSSKTSLNLSPASMAGLLLRGGAAAETLLRGGAAAVETVALNNFYGDALGFFGGIRIPATFFAGSSLAAIFTLKGAVSNLEDRENKITKLERRVIKFYHLTSLMAFLLSLNTVVTATSAHTAILHGRFNQMAETAYMMMKTEFEYEFVLVRWSFLTSIFCFLGMVTSRMLIEFDLLKKSDETRKDLAMLVVCSMGALATHLLSYVNQNLWCWRSLFGMTVYLAKLVMKRAFVEKSPMQAVSVLCALAAVFYVGKLSLEDMKED